MPNAYTCMHCSEAYMQGSLWELINTHTYIQDWVPLNTGQGHSEYLCAGEWMKFTAYLYASECASEYLYGGEWTTAYLYAGECATEYLYVGDA
jgi:hypothetical protein